MNSPIAQVGKTTTAQLSFEAGGKSSDGGGNFGAELDRVSTSKTFSNQTHPKDQATTRIPDRKPAELRSLKNSGAKRAAKPVHENKQAQAAKQADSNSAKTDIRRSRSADDVPDKPADHDTTETGKASEDDSLAGALAVEAVAKPVEPMMELQPVTDGEPDCDQDGRVSAAPVIAMPVETETTKALNPGADAIAALAGKYETQTGQLLPSGFELLKAQQTFPEPASAALPVSDSKMISIPQATQKPVEVPAQMEVVSNPVQQQIAAASVEQKTGRDSSKPVVEAKTSDDVATDALPLNTPDNDRRISRATRRADDGSPENLRGISTAKMVATMNNTPNKDEFAGSGRQDLPGRNFSAARTASINAKTPTAEGVIAAASIATAKSFDVRSDSLGVAEIARVEPTRMEKISELVSREVRMFKRAADDQVDVVLTPDAKTQISLRLQWRDGQVEVQAKCELGDHRSLSLQWTQLQTSLAQHGVRLAPLTERTSTGFTEFFTPSSFSQSQNGGGQRQPAPHLPSVKMPAVPSTPVVPVSRPGLLTKAAPTTDRFETWA